VKYASEIPLIWTHFFKGEKCKWKFNISGKTPILLLCYVVAEGLA